MKPHVWQVDDRMAVYKLGRGMWSADRQNPFLDAGRHSTWREAFDAAYEAMHG